MNNKKKEVTTIGVISDTHNLLRAEAVAALENTDLIVHAGDICKREILDDLQKFAPVIAVKGNNDKGAWAEEIPSFQTFTVNDISIYVIHDIKELNIYPAPPATKIIIYGHSHKSSLTERDNVIYLNPGSAGPKRFSLPASVALLKIKNGTIKAEVVFLAV